MVSSSGHFVVKLPKARVDELEGGDGQRFEASQGRPMKAREALEFVGG